MFTILIPKMWNLDDGRLILRLISRTTKKATSIRIIQAKATSIEPGDLPSDTVGDVVGWVDLSNGSKSYPVTKRINLGLLRRGTKLRDLIYGLPTRDEYSSVTQSDLDLLNGLRWIRPAGKNDAFRISHRLLNDFPKIDKRGVEIVERLFDGISQYQNVNDGSEVCNQIVYLHTLCRLRTITQRQLDANDTFSRVSILSGNEKQKRIASMLLGEVKEYTKLPAVMAIAASLESILSPRNVSSTSFAALRSNGSMLSIQQTGALAGVASAGNIESRSRIEIPTIEFPGFGTDINSRKSAARATVIYSANPRFLKSYLMRLVYYISLFPEFDYHFHLVASPDECKDLASLVLSTYELNQNIRGKSELIENISFSFSETPAEVIHKKSYFASVRYLIADQIMSITNSPVWIQDVDLFPTGEVAQIEKALRKNDVSLYVSSFAHGLFPWTRYLAGNVYVSNTAMGAKFLRSAASYLVEWLLAPNSWTVDQNALTFALDTCGPSLRLGNMKELKVPFTQSKLSIRIES